MIYKIIIKILFFSVLLFNNIIIFCEGQDNLNFNYKIKKDTKLEIININGSVSIESWENDYINIIAKKLSWSWEAKKELKLVDIKIQKNNNGNTLIKTEYNINPEKVYVYLDIKIPKEILIENINVNNGDITTYNVNGNINIYSSKGNININDLKGNIIVKTTNGSIIINDIIGNCTAETFNGKIELNNSYGDNILKNSSGKIEVSNANGLININNSIGDIRVYKNTGNIQLITSLGNIEANNINGYVYANNNNGKIKLKNVRGIIHAETNNGDIDAEIFSIFEKGTIIQADNGTIQLYLSEAINANLEINSQTGDISIQKNLNIYLNDDSLNHKEGIIGNGGNKISIITKNGSIKILKK